MSERLTFDPAAMRSAARTIDRVRAQVEADAMLVVNRPLPRMPPNVNAVVCTELAALRQTARAASHEFVSVPVELDLRALLAELADADCGPWDWLWGGLFDDPFLLDTVAPWGDMVCGGIPWEDIPWDDIPWSTILGALADGLGELDHVDGVPFVSGVLELLSYYEDVWDIPDAWINSSDDERIEAVFKEAGELLGIVVLSAVAGVALALLGPPAAVGVVAAVALGLAADWLGEKLGGWAGGELGQLVNWGIEHADEIVDAVLDGAEVVVGAIVDGVGAGAVIALDTADTVAGAVMDGVGLGATVALDTAGAIGGVAAGALGKVEDLFTTEVVGVFVAGTGTSVPVINPADEPGDIFTELLDSLFHPPTVFVPDFDIP